MFALPSTGGTGKGHKAGRELQAECVPADELTAYRDVPIGGANILLVDVSFNGGLGEASNMVAPLLGAAVRVGFVVGAFGTTGSGNHSSTWTLHRSGGELTPTMQHQLRKAIQLAQDHRYVVVNCN